MSDEPKYQPGDVVAVRSGKSEESRRHDFVRLKVEGRHYWSTYNNHYKDGGIWKDEIIRHATPEEEKEYEKAKLIEALE